MLDPFILTLKRGALPSDTLIGTVSMPFRPSKSYHFDIKVFRRVLPSEAAELVDIIDPMILDSIRYIYKDGLTASINLLAKLDLSQSTVLQNLQHSITDSIADYYRKKHLYRQSPELSKDVAKLITRFIDKYKSKLRDKLEDYEDIKQNSEQSIEIFLTKGHITSWRIWKITDSVARVRSLATKYHVDSARWRSIDKMMRSDDSLSLYFTDRTSNAWDFPWTERTYTAADLLKFKKVADTFYSISSELCNRVMLLQNDQTLLNALSNHDKLLLQNEMDTICGPLLQTTLDMTTKFDKYYALAQEYDSLPRSVAYEFKEELSEDLSDITNGLTSADFVTRGAWSMIADVGFAYVNTYPTGSVKPYVGVNFSFRPVNRQAGFNLFKHPYYSWCEYLWNSLSVTVGLSVFNGFNSKDRYTDLFGTTGSLLTGLSLRVSDGVRVSGGAMWAYLKDPDPASDKKTLTYIYYGSLSVDLTLKKWLGGLAKFFN
jgi:hypothetical protein